VQQALAEHLRAGDILFDIGANVGFFSVIGARLLGPSGSVYAFEPVPSNARCIRRNAALNDLANIEVVARAVSDRTGSAELMLASYSGGAALTTAGRPPDATTSISVEVASIDDLVATAAVQPPSVVKIDVEGAELEVLRGMAVTLREHRPVLICEIDDATPAGYESKYMECIEFIQSFAYDVKDLAPSYPAGGWLVGHFVASPRPRGGAD
jgi:FkbM family methyltransferase